MRGTFIHVKVTNWKIRGVKLSRKQNFSGGKIMKGYTILVWNFERRRFVKTWAYTNEELWRITKHKLTEIQIKLKKWNWIGHTLREESGAKEKTALDWNPQGYSRRGRPKRTWRKTIEDEIRSTGNGSRVGGDRNAWKIFMDGFTGTSLMQIV